MGNSRNDSIPNMACPFPPRTRLNHSLLEQGIKNKARQGKINVETIHALTIGLLPGTY